MRFRWYIEQRPMLHNTMQHFKNKLKEVMLSIVICRKVVVLNKFRKTKTTEEMTA